MSTDLRKFVDLAGGPANVARHCGVTSQAVSQWMSSGHIPVERVAGLEAASGGKVRAEDVRPDVHWMRANGRVTGYFVPLAAA